MWTCHHCGEASEEQFDHCWNCSQPRSHPQADVPPVIPGAAAAKVLTFRAYRGTMATWEELFAAAARFASDLGSERVLNISHSVDDDDGVVTVWYWVNQGNEDGSICGI